MGKASEALLSLRPVTFHYKKNIDPKGAPQFGLVAEEVEKVNPDLVVRDAEGIHAPDFGRAFAGLAKPSTTL
jgi:hypothetical protein